MSGAPGAGKTLVARSLPAILPRLTLSEALDTTRIYSVADMLPGDTPLIRQRPFRAPRRTISHAGLVGGGYWPRPGEISLAHREVLFLDELPEFGQHTLEVLRQPLEDKIVTISRAQGSLTFPANFMSETSNHQAQRARCLAESIRPKPQSALFLRRSCLAVGARTRWHSPQGFASPWGHYLAISTLVVCFSSTSIIDSIPSFMRLSCLGSPHRIPDAFSHESPTHGADGGPG